MTISISPHTPDWVSLRQATEIVFSQMRPLFEEAYRHRSVDFLFPRDHETYDDFIAAVARDEIQLRGKRGILVTQFSDGDITPSRIKRIYDALRKSDERVHSYAALPLAEPITSKHLQPYCVLFELSMLLQWKADDIGELARQLAKQEVQPSWYNEDGIQLQGIVTFCDVEVNVDDLLRHMNCHVPQFVRGRKSKSGTGKTGKRRGKPGTNENPLFAWQEVFEYVEHRCAQRAQWRRWVDLYAEVRAHVWKNGKKAPAEDTFRQKLTDRCYFKLVPHILLLQRKLKLKKLNGNLEKAGN